MALGFERIAEQRIREAQSRGDFDNLPGSGKPLKLDDDSRIPEDLRMAYKMLKNAGFVPPEIQIKKEIKQTRDLLEGAKDVSEKHRVLSKLNFLLMKLDSVRSTPAKFSASDPYGQAVAERMSKTAGRDTSKGGE